eukprot:2990308-Amphidinium_carterae.1
MKSFKALNSKYRTQTELLIADKATEFSHRQIISTVLAPTDQGSVSCPTALRHTSPVLSSYRRSEWLHWLIAMEHMNSIPPAP